MRKGLKWMLLEEYVLFLMIFFCGKNLVYTVSNSPLPPSCIKVYDVSNSSVFLSYTGLDNAATYEIIVSCEGHESRKFTTNGTYQLIDGLESKNCSAKIQSFVREDDAISFSNYSDDLHFIKCQISNLDPPSGVFITNVTLSSAAFVVYPSDAKASHELNITCVEHPSKSHVIPEGETSVTLDDLPIHGLCILEARAIRHVSSSDFIYSDYTTQMHFRTLPLFIDITSFATDTSVMLSFNYINGTTSYTISVFPTDIMKHVALPADYDSEDIKETIDGLEPNTNYSIILKLFTQNRTDIHVLMGGASVKTTKSTTTRITSTIAHRTAQKRNDTRILLGGTSVKTIKSTTTRITTTASGAAQEPLKTAGTLNSSAGWWWGLAIAFVVVVPITIYVTRRFMRRPTKLDRIQQMESFDGPFIVTCYMDKLLHEIIQII